MSGERKVYRTEVVLVDRDGGAVGHKAFDALIMRYTDGFLEFVETDRTVYAFNAARVVGYTMRPTGETVTIDDGEVDE